MGLKNVLVLLEANAASEERLRLAIELAQNHQACLSAAFLRKRPLAARSLHFGEVRNWLSRRPNVLCNIAGPDGVAVDPLERRSREVIEALGGDWYSAEQIKVSELVAVAQASDLIVAGQFAPHIETSSWRPEGIVLACGRPVLVIPYIRSAAPIGRRVLIAWDGSREATRALNDALPLLGAAEAVLLITIHSRSHHLEHGHPAIARVVRHLARHGISVQVEQTVGEGPVSEILLSRSADAAVDLIVAGAYGHSPFRESWFGGTSRELFRSMTLPVLMSH